jgi:hypothetical protein
MGCEVDSPVDFVALKRGFPLYVRSNSCTISYINSDLPHFLIIAHSTATITLWYSIKSSARPDNYNPQTISELSELLR